MTCGILAFDAAVLDVWTRILLIQRGSTSGRCGLTACLRLTVGIDVAG